MTTSNVGVVEVLEWLNSAGHADAAALVQTYLDARVAADGAVEEPCAASAGQWRGAQRRWSGIGAHGRIQAAPASLIPGALRQLEDGNDLEEEDDDDDDDFELDAAAARGGCRVGSSGATIRSSSPR